MLQSKIVFLKITVMFLVMVVGWWSARRQHLSPTLTKAMSVLVVQLTFPALVFVQMLETVSISSLQRGWWIPVFAGLSIVLAAWAGRGAVGFFGVSAESRKTFVFLVALPNWVFLPLPIAAGLYGAEGVRFVLLYNLGAQITLWTYCIRLLKAEEVESQSAWRMLLSNAGVMATVAGVILALCWPGMTTQAEAGPFRGLAINGVLGALKMIGDLTIPLSLLVAGAQLADLMKTSQFQWRPLIGVTLARLALAPFVTLLALKVVTMLVGVRLTELEFVTSTVIVTMPVAISCSMFADHYNGDRGLTASAIFITTLLSLLTVPAAVWCCHWLV
ncbi:MAG: AEC family transporter [bacterium]